MKTMKTMKTMKQELKITISSSEQEELMILAKKEKIDIITLANKIICNAIVDERVQQAFKESESLNSHESLICSTKWIDNYKLAMSYCSWISDEMINNPTSFLILQIAFSRIVDDIKNSINSVKTENFKTKFTEMLKYENRKKFSNKLKFIYSDSKFEYQLKNK